MDTGIYVFQIQNIFIIAPPPTVNNQLVVTTDAAQLLKANSTCGTPPPSIQQPPAVCASGMQTAGRSEENPKDSRMCAYGSNPSSLFTSSSSMSSHYSQPLGNISATSATEVSSGAQLSHDVSVLDAVPEDSVTPAEDSSCNKSSVGEVDSLSSQAAESENEPVRVEVDRSEDLDTSTEFQRNANAVSSETLQQSKHKEKVNGGNDDNLVHVQEHAHKNSVLVDCKSSPDLSNTPPDPDESGKVNDAQCQISTDFDQEIRTSSEVESSITSHVGNQDSEETVRNPPGTPEKTCSGTHSSTPQSATLRNLHMPSLFATPEKSSEIGFATVCLSVSPFHIPVVSAASPNSTVTTPVKVIADVVTRDLASSFGQSTSKDNTSRVAGGVETSAPAKLSESGDSTVQKSVPESPSANQNTGVTLVTSVYHTPILSSGLDKAGSLSLLNLTSHKTKPPLRKISPAKGYRSPVKTSPLKQVSPILKKYHKYSPKKKKLSPILPKITVSTILFMYVAEKRINID